VQDAAYGTLLREPRRGLHARVAEILETQFTEIGENQPELLARHYGEAGLIEKAATQWGKAGKRSHERSAFVEAVVQLSRALDLIATIPATPIMRREQINLQVALLTPLFSVKGFAAPEVKEAVERARLLIERAEARGESSDDPMMLFAVLFGFWVVNLVAFNGDMACELAADFLALAEKQRAVFPLMVGEHILGMSLVFRGDFVQSQPHFDRAIALYNPELHRPLATRFGGGDGRVVTWSLRSWALWMLGYPEAALADAERALKDAREIGQATTLMAGLCWLSYTESFCGNYASACVLADEALELSNQKGAPYWNAVATALQGRLSALTGNFADAVQTMTSGSTALR
jgi:tetratricopeptide (TPR) repeat protein